MKGHCCQQVGSRVYWFQKRCREIIPGCDCHYYTDIWWESVLTYAVLLHITWSGFSLFFGSSSAHQLNAFPRRRSDSGAIKQPFSVSRSSFRRDTYLLQISKWTYFVRLLCESSAFTKKCIAHGTSKQFWLPTRWILFHLFILTVPKNASVFFGTLLN